MVDEKEIKGIVEECIEKVVEDFEAHPYMFYTEQDIHCYLYHLLYSKEMFAKEYDTSNNEKTIMFHKEYPTVIRYRRRLKKEHKQEADYGVLRCEEDIDEKQSDRYGKPTRGHFDITIFNPHNIKKITAKNFRDKNKIPLSPLVAIEIALNNGTKHLINDNKKLTDEKNDVKYRYILHFIRDANLKQKKFECFQETIEEIRNKGKVKVYDNLGSQEIKC